MVGCSAFGCVNRSGDKHATKKPGITFHRFPMDTAMRSNWIKAVRRRDWCPTKYSCLCSEHFRAEDMDRTSVSTVRIRAGAIPSIFPAFPSYLQTNSKENTSERKRARRDIPSGDTEMRQENNAMDTASPEASLAVESSEVAIVPETPTKKKMRYQLKASAFKLSRTKKQIKTLKQVNRRLERKVAKLTDILTALKGKNLITNEWNHWLSNIAGGNKELLMRQISKANGKKKAKTFSPELRAFALTLHYYSPRAYVYVRSCFDSCLPHPRTLSRWYSVMNCMPGFSGEARSALHAAAEESEHPLLCSLIIDEMALRRHVEFDGKITWGYVQGAGQIDDDSLPLAKEALVFMLVCINSNWKLPMAYMLIDGLNGEQRCSLMTDFLRWLHHDKVKVVSLTFDGAYANISMANQLGCNLDPFALETSFPHPISREPVFVFLDPCHMLKLVRNTFGDKKVIIDEAGGNVLWSHLEALEEMQKMEGLHVANKLRSSHIHWQQQKMKVKLAAQLLSNSVADAILYCNSKGLTGFEDVSGTVRFLKIFNDLFDILNSRSLMQKGFKRPMDRHNYESIRFFFEEATSYITHLETLNGQAIIKSNRRTGFLGFLVSMTSAIGMYDKWVIQEKLLKYIPLYKASQDHIELYFGVIRSMSGFNNNPTSRQFVSAFKKVLVHRELSVGSRGNCLPFDRMPVLAPGKLSAIEAINASSWKGRMVADGVTDVNQEHNYSQEPPMLSRSVMSEYKEDVVRYIAGFIVRKLELKIKCEICVAALRASDGDNNVIFNIKNRGGLVAPSNDVVKVCLCAEKAIGKYIFFNGVFVNEKVIMYLTNNVVASYADVHYFDVLKDHVFDQSFEENHVILLLKLICQQYFKLRFHHEAKIANQKIHSKVIRHKLTKLILFQGQ